MNTSAASLVVDFSDSDIVVEDGTGAAVELSPVGTNGQALTQVELAVQLDDRAHLQITPNSISQVAFDLDLTASNTVDLATQKVTVTPFAVASVERPASLEARARGRLQSVDPAGGSYTIKLRPFHAVGRRQRDEGQHHQHHALRDRRHGVHRRGAA